MKKIDMHGHLGYWAFPIPGAGTAESLARLCEKYDIEYLAASATQALTYDMQAGNQEMAEAAVAHRPILAYCYCNPNFLEQSCAEMDRYLPLADFVGVKIHAGYSSCPTGDPRMYELMPEIAARTTLVKIHTGGADVIGHLGRFAESHASLNIIVAHAMGAGYAALADLAVEHRNIYLDFCSSWAWRGKVEYAIGTCGPEQVVFGSDMDLIDPAFTLGMFEGAGLTDEQKRMIYYGNGARLLGLS